MLLMCRTVFAESQISERQPREVRRALPVTKPLRNTSRGAGLETQTPVVPSRNNDRETRQSQSGSGGNSDEISQSSPNTMQALNDKRRIGIRDKLSFGIAEDELPQRQVVVTDSGEIDVPYIGRVAVENRTCKELAMYIKGLLEKEYYYHATVLIGLDSAGGQAMSRGRFYIDGQVNRTGAYEIPMDETLTVSRAIIRAGGFTQYANRKRVQLMRKNSAKSEMQIYYADMVAVMEKGQTQSDIQILPDDVVFVDEKFFNF